MSTVAAATPTPSRLYRGVRLEPDGRWAAHVSEGDGEGRFIGHFRKELEAALAHDRVALFLLGGAPTINFPPSFSIMERRFLRLCCTEAFVFRAVLDETYDVEYEFFLHDEFDTYLCRNASEETARAVAEFIARDRRWWERYGHNNKIVAHDFVMGHLNPVRCTSWMAMFREGDPNRSFFPCKEAHEREEMAARRAAEAKREAAEAEAAQQEINGPPPAPNNSDPAIVDRKDEEERLESSSPIVKPWSARTLLRRLERWLCRTFFDQFDESKEHQVPLLTKSEPWPTGN